MPSIVFEVQLLLRQSQYKWSEEHKATQRENPSCEFTINKTSDQNGCGMAFAAAVTYHLTWQRNGRVSVSRWTTSLPGHLEIPERTAIRIRERSCLSATWSPIFLIMILTLDRRVIQPFVPYQRLIKLGMRSAGVDYRWYSYVKNSDSEITNVTCESLFTALEQMAVQASF